MTASETYTYCSPVPCLAVAHACPPQSAARCSLRRDAPAGAVLLGAKIRLLSSPAWIRNAEARDAYYGCVACVAIKWQQKGGKGLIFQVSESEGSQWVAGSRPRDQG